MIIHHNHSEQKRQIVFFFHTICRFSFGTLVFFMVIFQTKNCLKAVGKGYFSTSSVLDTHKNFSECCVTVTI